MPTQGPVSEGVGGPAFGLKGWGEGLQYRPLDLLWREALGLGLGVRCWVFLVFVFIGESSIT